MDLHIFIFVWIAILAILKSGINTMTVVNVLGEDAYREKIFFASVAFFPIFWLASHGTPESDTWLYLDIFDNMPSSVAGMLQQIDVQQKGKGFVVFQCVIKMMFGNNRTAFRTILGLAHTIPFVLVMRKYSENYLLSILIFIASGFHLSWMMNGLRQYLAVMIIFAGSSFIFKRKYFPAILLILLAATIHSSAIIMLPVIFIVQGKAWNKKTLLFIAITILAVYVFSTYTGLLDSILEGTEYAGIEAAAIAGGDDGVHPLRVLVNAVPMIIALFEKRKIEELDDPVINVCVNMSVIITGIYLVGMVTSGIMIGRLPIYVCLYNLILLPYEIEVLFDRNNAGLIRLVTIVFYILYYVVQVGF